MITRLKRKLKQWYRKIALSVGSFLIDSTVETGKLYSETEDKVSYTVVPSNRKPALVPPTPHYISPSIAAKRSHDYNLLKSDIK